jgi:Kef-type K+ transport system membrane component KefB
MAYQQVDLLVIVLIMVVLARVVGELLTRKKQSAIVGEIFIGILLGPYVLRLVDPVRDTMLMAEIRGIAELGVFFLIFHAGIELSMKEVGSSIRKALPLIFGGLGIPFTFACLVIKLLGYSLQTSLFLGLCLSLTALPVTIRVLTDLGKMRTVEGEAILATAIGNDIGAMILLAILLNMGPSGTVGINQVILSVMKIVVFLIIVVIFTKLLTIKTSVEGKKIAIIRFYLNKSVHSLKSKESLFAITILFVLAFGGLGYLMGLHFLIGAFFGSVLVSRQLLGRENYSKVGGIISAVSMGFIAPIFFVYIGLSFYLTSYTLLYLVPIFLIIYISSKYLGGYLGASAMKLEPKSVTIVATGIANPGTMELIIANIGLTVGLITVDEFSIIILVVIIMMIVTPILLKRGFEIKDKVPAKDLAVDRNKTSSRADKKSQLNEKHETKQKDQETIGYTLREDATFSDITSEFDNFDEYNVNPPRLKEKK